MMGSHQLGARSAMCLADLVAVCRARCHHFVRTLPPSESQFYAEGHDRGMMETMHHLLGGFTGNELQRFEAHRIATLGGLGLRSASRLRHSAFWAS